MGANWGHQLGLRLWAAPVPRRLHPGGCSERLDRAEYPRVTTRWLLGPGNSDVKEAGTSQPPARGGEPGWWAGMEGLWVTGVQVSCIFCSNKHSPSPVACWLSTSVSQQRPLPALHMGPRGGRMQGGERPSRERATQEPLSSLLFKAPFYVNDISLPLGTQEVNGGGGSTEAQSGPETHVHRHLSPTEASTGKVCRVPSTSLSNLSPGCHSSEEVWPCPTP